MGRSLERGFTVDEIKWSVFSISADKILGLDGMNATFHQQHCDMVGPLISKAIISCLNEKADSGLINSKIVTLFPKVKDIVSVGDSQP